MLAKEKKDWRAYGCILIGTAVMAVSIKSIYDYMQMVTGGFSGLAIIIKAITEKILPGGIPLWFTNLVLNVPLFILGIRIKGWEFTRKSVLGAMMLSFWLYLIPPLPIIPDDMLLAALFGGVIMGIGIGFIFMGQSTTGGTDMVAALIQHRLRHYSVAQILQVIDGLIVLLGVFIFGLQKALYAVIAIVVTTKVTDGFLEGMKFAKIAFIITDNHKEMADIIMENLERGITGISSKGLYSGKDRIMLFCVVDKKQIVRLKEIVMQTDPGAFVIVTDAREVIGEGFHRSESL
ncbi:MAG: YitT family protein [Blautia sp.]